MEFQRPVSLLSIVAAGIFSSASFVQAEPIVDTRQFEQLAVPEAIETISWVERHGCSSDHKTNDNVTCDPESTMSPVVPGTVQDEIRIAMTDVFAVRFGFGQGQAFGNRADANVDWESAIRAEFDRVATQSGWAAQVQRHQNGFKF